MDIRILTGKTNPSKSSDLLVYCLREGSFLTDPFVQQLNKMMGESLNSYCQLENFKGKKNQTLLLHPTLSSHPQRVLLVGLGSEELYPIEIRTLGVRITKMAKALGSSNVSVRLHPSIECNQSIVSILVEGLYLGTYIVGKYQSADKQKKHTMKLVELSFASLTSTVPRASNAWIEQGVTIGTAVSNARDWVNAPPNKLTPKDMATLSQKIAKESGLTCQILTQKDCEKLGMGLFLGVAQGSKLEPYFIHLHYKPKTKAKKRVLLVGKGITFDSGGLTLKTPAGMETMKCDMGGAATALATMSLLKSSGCKQEVHALLPCAENMPSGESFRLGDILTSMSGKTVEINNTDAEGRLILADAITYGLTHIKPDEIIDFATLTGACVVGLGPYTAGVISNNGIMNEAYLLSAKRSGEEMWPLPSSEKLFETLKSDVADLRNSGGREGGAIIAGMFLKDFVGNTPWVHVDLAGPAFLDKEWGPYTKGGTGFGVVTTLEYLLS